MLRPCAGIAKATTAAITLITRAMPEAHRYPSAVGTPIEVPSATGTEIIDQVSSMPTAAAAVEVPTIRMSALTPLDSPVCSTLTDCMIRAGIAE